MYNFVPQLTKLEKNSDLYNKYYATNRYTIAGYGMPNCTAYALGRVNQLCDINNLSYNNFSGFHGNGETWGNTGYIGANWIHSQIPKLGAIVCYKDKSGIDIGGHVGIVEKIYSDGTICMSNSAWVNSASVGNDNLRQWWYLEDNIKPTDYRSNVFDFKYYLYPPYIDDEPTPGPGPIIWNDKSNFPFYIINRKKRNLTDN